MKILLSFLVFFLSLPFLSVYGQQRITVRDLKPEWKSYDGTTFVSYQEGSGSAVYFQLPTETTPQEYLRLQSPEEPFSFFINNSLAGSGTSFRLNIDSLKKQFASNRLVVGVFQQKLKPRLLITELETVSGQAILDQSPEKRESDAFRDFTILAALILIIMVVVIMRVNPKLSSDYFSIPRIFSLREFEDSQVYTRIASSTNILFYAYCSLLLGFYLIVIFHFVSGLYPLASSFDAVSFGGIFLQWLKLSSWLLIFLFIKIILVFGFSYLFGLGELAGVHFFNWIRLVLVFFGSLSIVLFIYFIWHGQDESTHAFMLKLLAWIIGGWMLLIYLKLSSKRSASLFHLFSYICATELIPFLIIIKVLYN